MVGQHFIIAHHECLSYLLVLLSFALFQGPVAAYGPLSDRFLKAIPRPGQDFNIHDGAILAPILIPRVPGSPGNAAVRNHIVSFFRDNLPDWVVEFQNSTSKTPVTGDVDIPFVNIIATRDAPWHHAGDARRLTLAAHYDSKLSPPGFIGATDSAAPCAIILHAIRSIDAALTIRWRSLQKEATTSRLSKEPGLQVFFFDGEEAFHSWTESDSLYGSRALAEHLEDSLYPLSSTFRNRLSSIDLLVLLDLIGTKGSVFPSLFPTTNWAYEHLARLEARMRGLGLMNSGSTRKEERIWFPEFRRRHFRALHISDDHIPFLSRGVDVLHLIAAPFPSVWHTMDDDAEHLDIDTVEDWGVLMAAFLGEWFELDMSMEHTPDGERSEHAEL